VLPLEAVLAAGLDTGVTLDRPRARRLGRELRRLEARDTALRALRFRDHTAATLRRRLDARGIPAVARETCAYATTSRAAVSLERSSRPRSRASSRSRSARRACSRASADRAGPCAGWRQTASEKAFSKTSLQTSRRRSYDKQCFI
jgi:hypothetical protein